MPERLYQLRFGEDFTPEAPQEVTPKDFGGLLFPTRSEIISLPAHPRNRFVREVGEIVKITSPNEAARYLLEQVYTPFEQFDQEELWTLLLNNKNQITHEVMVYRGTVNSVLTRTAEVLKEAVRVNATSLILSHIHPSGDPTPSPEDITVTRQIKQAADLLGIDLQDHIVVGKDAWVSLRSRGLGFD